MRETLYRGKKEENGEWIYGDLRKRHDDKHYRIASKEAKDMNEDGGYRFWEVEEETLGEYTGVNDIIDSKIFTTDIIIPISVPEWLSRYDRWMHKAKVVFYEGSYTAIFYYLERSCRLDEIDCWEVIGNIVDNTELLGEGEE